MDKNKLKISFDNPVSYGIVVMSVNNKQQNNMKKIYTYENITFGSTGQKWSFTAPGFEFKTSLPGGRETAEKVARIVNGSLKRTKGVGLDNLGRTNIETIVNKVKAANHENFNLH